MSLVFHGDRHGGQNGHGRRMKRKGIGLRSDGQWPRRVGIRALPTSSRAAPAHTADSAADSGLNKLQMLTSQRDKPMWRRVLSPPSSRREQKILASGKLRGRTP